MEVAKNLENSRDFLVVFLYEILVRDIFRMVGSRSYIKFIDSRSRLLQEQRNTKSRPVTPICGIHGAVSLQLQ